MNLREPSHTFSDPKCKCYCLPVVSVVIPCYNYASYLPSAVQSVLEQAFQAFEIIIVNDGSTDNTTEVARRLIAENPRITMSLVNQANSGHPALARNAGIRCATGEYILCLDADDVIAPSALSRMREALDRNPKAGVAYCYIQHFGSRNDVWKNGEFTLSALRKDNVIPYCSLFRKQIWSQLGGMKSDAGFEDWEFWLSMCEENWTGVLIPEPLFGYRQHAEGRFSEDSRKRSYLIAKMIVHHPRTFSPEEMAEARTVIRQWENSPIDDLVQEARQLIRAVGIP